MLMYLRAYVKSRSLRVAESLEHATAFRDAIVDMADEDEVGPKQVRRYIRLEMVEGAIPPLFGRWATAQSRRLIRAVP